MFFCIDLPLIENNNKDFDITMSEECKQIASKVSEKERDKMNIINSTPTLQLIRTKGEGRTSSIKAAASFYRVKGFETVITSVVWERANVLGGIHLMELLGIPRTNISNYKELIELEIIDLDFIKRLEVIIIEEMTLLSPGLLSEMDVVLRETKHNSTYMGGTLVIGFMDVLQLPPVEVD